MRVVYAVTALRLAVRDVVDARRDRRRVRRLRRWLS